QRPLHGFDLDDRRDPQSSGLAFSQQCICTLEPSPAETQAARANLMSEDGNRAGLANCFSEVAEPRSREKLRELAFEVVDEGRVDELEQRDQLVAAEL